MISMIRMELYKYELKKLFCGKVNLIATAGAVVMLVILVISFVSEGQPVSREAAKILDGRVIDGQLIEELKPAMRYENGSTIIEITEEYEKYVPVMDVITSVTGYDGDLTRLQGEEFYSLRETELAQRIEKQRLSEKEKEFWQKQEAQVRKPFVYHYHSGPANLLKAFQALGFFILLLAIVGLSGVYAKETADNMNQLLLCSRYGKKELYPVKFAAGLTWILAAALLLVLTILIPYTVVYGMEGTGEMLQLVKPKSMLPWTLGRMLAVFAGIFLMAAVLFAAVAMLLSVVTQNQLAVTCGLLGYLLVDLFVELPDRFGVLQKIWSLRPNAVLMNTGFSNYRLIHLAGRLFTNYQAAPVVYAVIVIAALFIGREKYRKLQVGK
ncbi:MAG: hypothetical protein J6P87_03570 [Lachnospiraceae bacterium]|nr:hypothetical protein [Lachnospiraceae bacterium]